MIAKASGIVIGPLPIGSVFGGYLGQITCPVDRSGLERDGFPPSIDLITVKIDFAGPFGKNGPDCKTKRFGICHRKTSLGIFYGNKINRRQFYVSFPVSRGAAGEISRGKLHFSDGTSWYLCSSRNDASQNAATALKPFFSPEKRQKNSRVFQLGRDRKWYPGEGSNLRPKV